MSQQYEFNRTAFSREILDSFKDDAPQRTVAIAGRILSLRKMGKASFCHVMDSKGKIQVYLKKDDLRAIYDAFRLLDIGDIVGVEGYVFRTKMGEISVHSQKRELRAKSLRPIPIAKETKDGQGNVVVHGIRFLTRYSVIVNGTSISWLILISKTYSSSGQRSPPQSGAISTRSGFWRQLGLHSLLQDFAR